MLVMLNQTTRDSDHNSCNPTANFVDPDKTAAVTQVVIYFRSIVCFQKQMGKSK